MIVLACQVNESSEFEPEPLKFNCNNVAQGFWTHDRYPLLLFSRVESHVDPDQLASQKPADLDLHCFQNIMLDRNSKGYKIWSCFIMTLAVDETFNMNTVTQVMGSHSSDSKQG